MANYTYVNGNLQILAEVLDASGYFDQGGVTYTPGANFGYITCTKGNLTFQLGESFQSMQPKAWSIIVSGLTPTCQRAAYAGGAYSSYNQLDYKPLGVYVCSNGISIVCQYGRIAIGMTNNNETAVMFGSDAADRNISPKVSRVSVVMDNICAIAESDTTTFKFITNNSTLAQYYFKDPQTYLIPVPTNGSPEKVSYTPSVMLVWLAQTRDVCHFSYNNKRYFSDGYFAIEDTAS